ncbi:hypothetical protein PG994_005625 [Apiospora phragmitis]|uniref:Uncharacterized protein n=1 Tax=Apiospora phragmitis TaxID=2905665 RepID=A0ABR1VCS0_9PEZI
MCVNLVESTYTCQHSDQRVLEKAAGAVGKLCKDCVNEDSKGKDEDGKKEPSLRRLAILNRWCKRLNQEVEWNPVGAVDETLSYRLLNLDTTLEGAELWSRIIATLPGPVFGLEEKLSLAHTWLHLSKDKFLDEDLAYTIYTQFRLRANEKPTTESFDGFQRRLEEIGRLKQSEH